MMGAVERHDELTELDLTEEEIDAMLAAGEMVDVVGPPEPNLRARFEVFVDEAHQYGWRLASSNGTVLARSETFATRAAALRAVRAVMRASAEAALVDRSAS